VRTSLPVWTFGDDQCHHLGSRARYLGTTADHGDGNAGWMYDHTAVMNDSEQRVSNAIPRTHSLKEDLLHRTACT